MTHPVHILELTCFYLLLLGWFGLVSLIFIEHEGLDIYRTVFASLFSDHTVRKYCSAIAPSKGSRIAQPVRREGKNKMLIEQMA